jgi:hypothetical protein
MEMTIFFDVLMVMMLPILFFVGHKSTRAFNRLHEQRAKAIYEKRMFRADALSREMLTELVCFGVSATMCGVVLFYFYVRAVG